MPKLTVLTTNSFEWFSMLSFTLYKMVVYSPRWFYCQILFTVIKEANTRLLLTSWIENIPAMKWPKCNKFLMIKHEAFLQVDYILYLAEPGCRCVVDTLTEGETIQYIDKGWCERVQSCTALPINEATFNHRLGYIL